MEPERSRKREHQFVETFFDPETHQFKRTRVGKGREVKLSKERIRSSQEVKRAGGQCIRCKTLKKKVRRRASLQAMEVTSIVDWSSPVHLWIMITFSTASIFLSLIALFDKSFLHVLDVLIHFTDHVVITIFLLIANCIVRWQCPLQPMQKH